MLQYSRHLEIALRAASAPGKARLVLGARQTGKTTLFARLRPRGALLVDLQERSERMRFARDPGALARAALAMRTAHGHILIDEVQRVPALLDEIQLLLDRHAGRFTFTITGSSARRLRRGSANLLPGRVHRHLLSPVCLWEQSAGARPTVLRAPRHSAGNPFPRRALEDSLVLGSLPAAFLEGAGFRATLASYAETYIEEEVLREMAARNLGDYGRFLELAAIESGRPINLTRLSQESGIALSTIRGFYAVLEDTLLGFTVGPYLGSSRARLLKTPKFYFFDVGVRNAVARLPLEAGILATQGGQLFEHWVACELAARIGYLGRAWRLSYWRTVDGAAVDFILETPKEAIPIEVKYTRNPRSADASGVEHFIARHPGKAKRGFVVCRCGRPEQLGRHTLAIPWEQL